MNMPNWPSPMMKVHLLIKIADMEKTIQNKYAATFDELYNALHTTAMAYAAKHGINVREVNPAPTQ